MPRLPSQLTPGQLWPTFDSWVLRILSRPPVSRAACILIVATYVTGIGVVDYLSGTTLSLQVFYLAPIALAVAWLGLMPAFFTAVVSIVVRVGGDYLQHADYTRRPSIVWNTIGFLATYMIVAWILNAFIRLRRELEERVNSRTSALAQEIKAREELQREMLEISERERRIIGNDLHDGLGQHLTAMAFAAEVLIGQLPERSGVAAKTAQELGRLAEDGIRQSRQLARGLLLTAIEPASLRRELQELAVTVDRQGGVACRFESPRMPTIASSGVASHIFRIAQEAVRNSLKHAQPTEITLILDGDEHEIILTISDNGLGLPALQKAEAETGVGLRVMAQRAKLLGGELTIESLQGRGTRIRCHVPLQSAPKAMQS